MIACNNSGHDVFCDFVEVSKIVDAGAASKPVQDYELSRYACYLIVQNGDPRKEVIALGQTYFAIQTYRQEVADRFNQLDEDSKRLVVRGDIRQWDKLLAEAARDAGVITPKEFATFQNKGYMGLLGDLLQRTSIRKKDLKKRTRSLITWEAQNSLPICSA
jgi:DNA-damage-inducible protein D